MSKTPDNVTPLRPKLPCPICGKASVRALFPFCSARCKDIDLSKWLTGSYAIPVRDDEDEEGDGIASSPETEA